MEYLLEKGISKERLLFKGYGETKPKVPNNSSKSRMINRRTDFLIF
jgi:outer membrane protein OmpA-like peptidoglycan-associated protein